MIDKLGFVILAAGKGTRMHSDTPKVMQRVLNKTLLNYVYDALHNVPQEHIWTVVGFGADTVVSTFSDCARSFILQEEQLGTGHAVQIAMESLLTSGVLYFCVINGDTPFVPLDEIESLANLCQAKNAAMGMITIHLDDPYGYGRVVRSSSGNVIRVIEEKDFIREVSQENVYEVNSGIYIFNLKKCASIIASLDRNNAQREYYLTQMINLCSEHGHGVEGIMSAYTRQLRGINSPSELVVYEEMLRATIVQDHLAKGVTVRRGDSVVIGPDVEIAPGVEITGPCEIYGKSRIERGARIDSHCWIRDSIVGPCQVKSFSHIEGSEVLQGAIVGPFARLRPGTRVGVNARVGNFVEVKKSVLHEGAKAGHLSYLGDSDIGAGVNIGAGTITCNYDGQRKHRTEIHDNAFIGSNTALVAPVTVGAGALVAAGSVVTKDVPPDALCVARARQVNLERKRKNSP